MWLVVAEPQNTRSYGHPEALVPVQASWVLKMFQRLMGSSSLLRCLLLPVFVLARNKLTMVFPTLLQTAKGVKKYSVIKIFFWTIHPNFLNFPKGSVEALGTGSSRCYWLQITLSNLIRNLVLKNLSDLKLGIQTQEPGNDFFVPILLNTFDFNLQEQKEKSELLWFPVVSIWKFLLWDEVLLAFYLECVLQVFWHLAMNLTEVLGGEREKSRFNLSCFWRRILDNKSDLMNQSLFWKQRAFNCLLDRLQGFGESSRRLLGR